MVEKHRFYDSFGNLVDERNRGDFDGDGEYTIADIDTLIGLIAAGGFGEAEDLNNDGVVDDDDMDVLILDVIGTLYGDAELDGSIDISDFNIWNTNKFTNALGWQYGDFDGNGVVDISDFNIWSANKWQVADNFDPLVTEHIFGFTGRMFDTSTGLQNNLNRWYDPAVGRWISEDPISFAAGDANIYRYVSNSSLNWIDPDGLQMTPGATLGYPTDGQFPFPPFVWPKSRPLTEGEKEMVETTFKGKLDPDKIKIVDGGFNPFDPEGPVVVPFGNPWFPDWAYSDDFSKEGDQHLFIHEMTHCLQYQQGKFLPGEAVIAWWQNDRDYDAAYDYEEDDLGKKPLKDFNLEQQADIIADNRTREDGSDADKTIGDFDTQKDESKAFSLPTVGFPASFPVNQ